MLFKAYPTYVCSLKDTLFKRHVLFNNILYSTTYFVQQHILLFNIYGLYNIFVQHHIYVFKQHIYVFEQHIYVIESYRTHVSHLSESLNNIYVILM